MIEYINHRYNTWASWCIRGRDNGLGYPKACNFTRLTPGSGTGFQPTMNEDAWEVEQCVARLEPAEQHLVKLFYLTPSVNVAQVARELHCARDTVYARLHTVHNKTLGWLNDLAAGVNLPPVREIRRVEQVRKWRVR